MIFYIVITVNFGYDKIEGIECQKTLGIDVYMSQYKLILAALPFGTKAVPKAGRRQN